MKKLVAVVFSAGLALVVLVIAVQYWSAKREKAITA